MLARETRRTLAEVTAITATADVADAQIEEAIVHALFRTRIHQLMTQLLHVAPAESLTYFTLDARERLGLGITYLTDMLTHAQKIGLIDRYDPRPVAEIIARLAHSMMLTPRGGIDFTDTDRVRLFIRTAIVPIMKYGLRSRPAANSG